ncbi:hypothetical protein FQN54_009654 [Arachnomyces sp. PD_36]|nr:hypothetical protein FQN54_009654 [Arachnomyces sp. PD_36]
MDDRRTQVRGVTLALFVIATFVVIIRFISCAAVVKKVALHDYFMLVAWLLAFGFSFSVIYGTTKGLGLHEWDVDPAKQFELLKAEYVFAVLYNPTLMAIKTSILVFYFTLTGNEKVYLWANYLTIALVNGAGIALTFLTIFQCRPFSATFHYPIPPNAKCIDIVALFLSSAPINIITDLIILFLPLPILTAMFLPKKQKIILIFTFGFGAFVTIVDIVRLTYLQEASVVGMDNRGDGQSYGPNDELALTDYSWYASYSFMWSAIEINTGIICACVPLLKPLVARVLPRMIKDVSDQVVPSLEVISRDPAPPSVPQGGQFAAPVHRPPTDPTSEPRGSISWDVDNLDEERTVAMVDFLNTSAHDPRVHRLSTVSDGSNMLEGDSSTYFDFVNIKTPKNMLKMTNKESIFPNAMATILFFLWGFAYGLLAALNHEFEKVVKTSKVESLGLRASYFGAYMVGALVIGRQVLKHWSFKGGFVVGLFIYAGGTLVFWPSAVLFSYVALVISNFLVGLGLAVVETAANPFIALCGPMEHAEVRLNISQGFQAIGGVVSPLLAIKVFFRNTNTLVSLINAQWAYLGIAFFDVLLAIVFYYLPLPDASDADLKQLADRRREDNFARIRGVPIVWMTFGLGVFSQFCYVGGQEVFYIKFQAFVTSLRHGSDISPFDYELIGHSLFAIGRFLTALAIYYIKPRWVLLASYIGIITVSALAMDLKGTAGISMGLLIYFLEGGLFSTIFAIPLRGMGGHTKTAGAIMTAAVSGGAVFPFVQDPVEYAHGISYSFCVLVALFAAGAVFPIYLNLVPAAKRQVDPVHGEHLRRRHRHGHGRHLVSRSSKPSTGGRKSVSEFRRRLSHPYSWTSRQQGGEERDKERVDVSGGSASSPDQHRGDEEGGGGGIMHDLAPWPSQGEDAPHQSTTTDSSVPIDVESGE